MKKKPVKRAPARRAAIRLKRFEDLKFERDRAMTPLGSLFGMRNSAPLCRASLHFPNGYGVSVITGAGTYTNGPHEFELAVMKNGQLCYTTPITEDVMGHLSMNEVTRIMAKVQLLRASKKAARK